MSEPARQRPFLAVYGVLRQGDSALLMRRRNTGFADGLWGLPAGHVDAGEDFLSAASREMAEELGVAVDPADWVHRQTLHRRSDRLGIDLFLDARRWRGAPSIREPEKCDALAFRPLDRLDETVIDYVRAALAPDAPVMALWGWDTAR